MFDVDWVKLQRAIDAAKADYDASLLALARTRQRVRRLELQNNRLYRVAIRARVGQEVERYQEFQGVFLAAHQACLEQHKRTVDLLLTWMRVGGSRGGDGDV